MEPWESLTDGQKDLVRLHQQGLQARLDRIEAKLDQVIEFNALVAEAAAPFLSGKGGKWLALIAKTKGARN